MDEWDTVYYLRGEYVQLYGGNVGTTTWKVVKKTEDDASLEIIDRVVLFNSKFRTVLDQHNMFT